MGNDYRARKTLTGNDYFPTYHALTRLLLNNMAVSENLRDQSILEPCSGNGDISLILKEFDYQNIKEIDIDPRNKTIKKLDFFEYNKKTDYIVTNPPYNVFMKFFKHALTIINKGMYLLLPLDYLHGGERYEAMYKELRNLKTVYIFVRRPLFSSKYKPSGLMPTGATTFAWFHFEKEYYGLPTIAWLDNRKNMGVPTEIDQLEFNIVS